MCTFPQYHYGVDTTAAEPTADVARDKIQSCFALNLITFSCNVVAENSVINMNCMNVIKCAFHDIVHVSRLHCGCMAHVNVCGVTGLPFPSSKPDPTTRERGVLYPTHVSGQTHTYVCLVLGLVCIHL